MTELKEEVGGTPEAVIVALGIFAAIMALTGQWLLAVPLIGGIVACVVIKLRK